MQPIRMALLLVMLSTSAFSQYYFRGEIRDSFNNPIANARIILNSSGSLFMSGNTGGFGISSRFAKDTFIISKDGFVSESFPVSAKEYLHLKLKMNASSLAALNPRLISLTPQNKKNETSTISNFTGETYSGLIENDFINTATNPQTIFSLRIDKAAYSNVRRILNQNEKVPPDAIRTEEMLNYFNFNYQSPEPGNVFHIQSQLTDCPWNKDRQLLFINICAKKIKMDSIPPSNLVFLIDVSASMDQPNRLPLIKESLQLLVKNLRPTDTVSIVVYGGDIGLWLSPTDGGNQDKLIASIEKLRAGGDTPGEDALKTAYMLARKHFIKDGNNRIILATDGDFNVGSNTEKKLEELIGNEKQFGISLSCIGVGMGNYKDSKIEILSKKGNGNFAYIDSLPEAEKIFMTEFTQTIYSVAKNVKVSISFDSLLIKDYRLIGYENKKESMDSKSQDLEGGEIGSGSSNTIIFEVMPTQNLHSEKRMAQVKINYQSPQDTARKEISFPVMANYVQLKQLSKPYQLATAVTMFSLKLRQSKYFSNTSWGDIISFTESAINHDRYIENQLFLLIQKAQSIYEPLPKKSR